MSDRRVASRPSRTGSGGAAAALLLACFFLTGCSPSGSQSASSPASDRAGQSSGETAESAEIDAFCAVIEKHKDRFETTMSGADTTSGLVNILVGVSAVGDHQLMWAEIAETARADIAADAQAISDAWQSQTDAAVSRDWAASIAIAMLSRGSAPRLNAYIVGACGPHLAPAGVGFWGLEAPDVSGDRDTRRHGPHR